ncbi:hypothetical protein HW132_34870 [Brasilonema sp. CT11]|nr:hypothetical protein [Brasilonema sp. CT11]
MLRKREAFWWASTSRETLSAVPHGGNPHEELPHQRSGSPPSVLAPPQVTGE